MPRVYGGCHFAGRREGCAGPAAPFFRPGIFGETYSRPHVGALGALRRRVSCAL